MGNLEYKVIRKKKLDKELTLRILRNPAAERIIVEFSSKDGKMLLQRNFQDTHYGRTDADAFEEKIKSIDDLKSYFNRS